MDKTSLNLIRKISQAIYEKKGENIIAIDVRGISSITDYILIANGNVDRHVIAIAKTIKKILEDSSQKPVQIEGLQSGDWIILDYFQIVIHLFIPEMRQKYQLERLWPEGKIIDLGLHTPLISKVKNG